MNKPTNLPDIQGGAAKAGKKPLSISRPLTASALLLSVTLAACGGSDSSSAPVSSNPAYDNRLEAVAQASEPLAANTSDTTELPGVGIVDSLGDDEARIAKDDLLPADSTLDDTPPHETMPSPDEHATVANEAQPAEAPATGNGEEAGPDLQAGNSQLQRKAVTTRLIAPSGKGISLTSPDHNRLYGPGVFNMNALGNTVIGSYNRQQSMVSSRFLATASGHMNYIRILLATGTGYSSGTGGTIRVTLRNDDGSSAHLPNMGQVLATASFRPALPANQPKKTFPQEVRFSGKPHLQAGKIYHLLFENIDPNPASNFISIDHSVMHSGNGRSARWTDPKDWATLFAVRPLTVQRPYRWINLTTTGSQGNLFSPILEIGLTNGQVLGAADMESGSVDPARTYTVTAAKPIREHFRPSQTRVVSGISVATAAVVGGSLRWRLMHGSRALAGGRIQQPTANYAPLRMNTGLRVTNMVWYHRSIWRNITLQAGQDYYLEFVPEDNSQWKFAPHRNGSFFNFKWPAAFTDSNAQHLLKGRWVNTHFWNYNYADSAGGYNWPVVLHLAP